MYQSAARSFRKESTASCRFLQEFIWAQAARAALRRLPRHSAARHFLPAEVDRLLGQHELEHAQALKPVSINTIKKDLLYLRQQSFVEIHGVLKGSIYTLKK